MDPSASLRLERIPAPAPRVLLVATLLAGCSVAPASSSQPAVPPVPTVGSVTPTVAITPERTTSAPTTPTPSGPVPIQVGVVPAGRYITTALEPTVTLTLPSDGWLFYFQDDNDEMAVGQGDLEVTAGRVANVKDPATHAIVPAPDDLVSWLASHPGLKAEPPQPATVGGIVGQSIEVANTGTDDVDIFAFPTGDRRVAAGTTTRFWVLPFDGPDLVFAGDAPSAGFQQALPILQSVIDSIVITPD